jgi:hypothetical protein
MPPVMTYELRHVSLEIDPAEEPARSYLVAVLNETLDWVVTLDDDDQAAFWSEVRQTIGSNGTRGDLETVVRDWEVTAKALRDPLSRELLLAERHEPEEYQEVERPA